MQMVLASSFSEMREGGSGSRLALTLILSTHVCKMLTGVNDHTEYEEQDKFELIILNRTLELADLGLDHSVERCRHRLSPTQIALCKQP